MRRFVQAFVDEHSFAAGLPAALTESLAAAPQRFNIGKNSGARVLCSSDGSAPHVAEMAWGLVPRWSKEPHTPYTTVTARLQRAPRSRIFASAWQHRRCVVPMSGYYKWDRQRRPPWPMFVQRQDGSALLAAGLWEHWEDADGQQLDSFTVLTAGNDAIPEPLSADGPVFIDAATAMAWLSGALSTPAQLQARAFTPALEAFHVGLGVRDATRDDYTLLEPVTPDAPGAGDAVAWDGDGLDDED